MCLVPYSRGNIWTKNYQVIDSLSDVVLVMVAQCFTQIRAAWTSDYITSNVGRNKVFHEAFKADILGFVSDYK